MGQSVKILRTDNGGGEFTSTTFTEYLRIKHELIISKCPQQNGVAEKLNRTLVEMVRSMLADSKLAKSFWAEAFVTAVYLRNCSPTKAVEGPRMQQCMALLHIYIIKLIIDLMCS